MNEQNTTIQINQNTKFELLKIKGELLIKDGIDRTFDDVIRELIYYWSKGVKKKGYNV